MTGQLAQTRGIILGLILVCSSNGTVRGQVEEGKTLAEAFTEAQQALERESGLPVEEVAERRKLVAEIAGQLEEAARLRQRRQAWRTLLLELDQHHVWTREAEKLETEALPAKKLSLEAWQELAAATEERSNEVEALLGRMNELEVGTADRMGALPAQLKEARGVLGELTGKVGRLQPPTRGAALQLDDLLELARLEQARERVESLALEVELRAEHAELLADGAEVLHRLREGLRLRREDLADTIAKLQREQVEADEAYLEDLRRQAEQIHPEMGKLAAFNLTVAEERSAVRAQQVEQQRRLIEVRTALQQIDTEYKTFSESRQQRELTPALGLLLRKKLAELPSRSRYVRYTDASDTAMDEVSRRLMELEQARVESESLRTLAEAAIEEFGGRARQAARELLAKLIVLRRDLLVGLSRDYNQFLHTLIELHASSTALLAELELLRTNILQHVFWVRGYPGLGPAQFLAAVRLFPRLADRTQWGETLRGLSDDVRGRGLPYLLLLLLVLGALGFVRKLRRFHAFLPGAVPDPGRWGSWRAVSVTFVASAIIPGVMAFLGWRLDQAEGVPAFGTALGRSLSGAALSLWPIFFLLQTVRAGGIGGRYFSWSSEQLDLTATALRRFTTAFVPFYVGVSFFEALDDELFRGLLGRSFFVFGLVLFLGGLRYFFPKGACAWLEPTGWFRSLRKAGGGHLPVVGLIVLVAGLGGFAIAGYYYTTIQIFQRLHVTIGVMTGLFTLRAVVLYHLRQGWYRRDLASPPGTRQRDPLGAHTFEAPLASYLTLLAILVAVHAVWKDLLPALNILETTVLWTVGGVGSEPRQAVSLFDLALALVISSGALLLRQRLPEFLLAWAGRKFSLSEGARQSVSILGQYLIITLAVVLPAGLLGVSWAKIQWLVAAFGVGLGFGLQEIFGNFVSGIIILFEQPIRVGDVVTVGDLSGRVTQIRIRATTIEDWDRKELIIPNKEFITGKVVNWTLSSPVVREVIEVGVAYGSDIALVEKTLLEVAAATPDVLAEPAPSVVFNRFGESSLDFSLRVYLDGVERLLQVRHQVHCSLDALFRERDIGIPFPQREVHLVRD